MGGKTVNQGLRGPGCDISAVSVPLVNTTQAKNYFGYDWKPCSMPGTTHGWASEPTAANQGTFQLLEKEPAGRVSWLNASIQAMPATQCQGKPCFLEGSAAGAGSRCGEPSKYRCRLGCILLKMTAISLLTGLHLLYHCLRLRQRRFDLRF